MRALMVPVLFAVGIVLGQTAQVDGSAWVALRPLVLAALLGAVCYLVFVISTRRTAPAVIGSAAAVLVLGGLWYVVAGAVMLAVLALYWRHIHRRPAYRWDAIATAVRRLAGIFTLVGLVSFAMSQPILSYPRPSAVRAAAADLPPMYFILLDGYPRQDMLNEYFDTDNAAFLGALEERGFDVYPEATSNHSLTALTLATMFNATPGPELTVSATSRPGQFRALHELFNDGSVWDALREAGYHIVTIPPTPDGPKLMTADVSLDEGHMTGFEVHLIESTALGALFDIVGVDPINDQHRARILAGFEALEKADGSGRFVWAHLFVPHRPVVFRADGSAREVGACQVECNDAQFYPAFDEQLFYTNDRVLAAVDELPPNAPVVIFSDHGSREPADAREWLRTLLVARTPGHPRLFGDEPQPLGWFPRLLNTYAETHIPEVDGGHWRSGELPMDLDPIDP